MELVALLFNPPPIVPTTDLRTPENIPERDLWIVGEEGPSEVVAGRSREVARAGVRLNASNTDLRRLTCFCCVANVPAVGLLGERGEIGSGLDVLISEGDLIVP